MSADTRLDPNWLATDLDEATTDLAMQWSPCQVAELMQPPLGARDKARLRQKMAARYREWTGRDLAADLATDPAPETSHAL